MELRHLRYFVAVARHLSFSGASRSIHVAQAALSETIKSLEEELGVELLARTRQSVMLTAAGESFLRDSERILRDVADASRAADLVARGETGRLAIGFLGATAAPFLPKLLREFHGLHPHVQLSLFDGTPHQLTVALTEGRIDVAISRPDEEGARQIPMDQFTLFSAELCAVLPRDHGLARGKEPLRLKALAREPIILAARTSAPLAFDAMVASCRKAGFVPNLLLAPNHLSTVLVLIEAGLGVGIVSGSAAHSVAARNLVFREIAPKTYSVATVLTWPRGTLSPTAAAFIEYVKARSPAIAKEMRFPKRA